MAICPICQGSKEIPDYGDLSEDSGFVDCMECDGKGVITSPSINLTELLADREAGLSGVLQICSVNDRIVEHDGDDPDCYETFASCHTAADARRIARLPDLEAAYIEAVELLRRFVDVNDEPCRRDHHGYCQAHNLEEDCMVDDARKFLGDE